MNLFDEERLYERAADELASGEIRKGLWVKALSDVNGNEEAAKARYIKLRVAQYKDQITASRNKAIISSVASYSSVIAWVGFLIIVGGLLFIIMALAYFLGTGEGQFRDIRWGNTVDLLSMCILGWLTCGGINFFLIRQFTLHPWQIVETRSFTEVESKAIRNKITD